MPTLQTYGTVNTFRRRRGRVLRAQIDALADHLGRDIVVLDVGGRPDYWCNVGFERIQRIYLTNFRESELNRPLPQDVPAEIFTREIGDARDLSAYADKSVDLAHSNSVIEHVGAWSDMQRMASELIRVGRSGWVQTPAWSFPVEPHYLAPFLHWFAPPLRSRMLSLSLRRGLRSKSLVERREHVERINLLSRGEVKALFPGCSIYVERVILAKSYAAHWMPVQ